MKRVTKLATLTGVAAATAGAAVAVYAVNHKDDHQTKESLISDITMRLNSIPNATTIITEDELEKQVNDLIVNRTNDIDNMQQAIVKLIQKRLEESNTTTTAYIDGNIATTKELFKYEIAKHETVLNDQINELSKGIVGDHDLNYYKEILDDSVDSSQFDELYNSVDSLDKDLNDRIDELQTDLTKDKTELAAVKTGLTNLISTEMAGVDATVDALKASLNTAIDKVATDTGSNLSDLKLSVDGNAKEIKRLLTETSANANGINSLSFILAETVKKVNGNALTINDMALSQSLLAEANGELKSKIDDLASNIIKVEALSRGNDTEITALKAAAKVFTDKLDLMNAEIANLSIKFAQLTQRVEKNENDIQTLFTMIKNTDATVNTHIEKTLSYMVDTDKTIADIQDTVVVNQNTFDKRLLISEKGIEAINAELTNIKGDVSNITQNVTDVKDQIIAFDNGIKKINDTVAEILQDVDDLAKVVNDNEAKYLGLEGRVALLEKNSGGSTASEIIYETASNNLHNIINNFHFTKDIASYKQLQILYQDAPSARYGSMVLNIDQMKEVVIYAGGDRMHPNRTWYAFQVDYPNKTMRIAFYFAAGNNSWAWNYNLRGINIKQIVGIL